MQRLSITALLLLAPLAHAAGPVFDSHVHLRNGETSLRQFLAEQQKAGLELSGAAVMWFGGPHQARAGKPADIRAGNDQVIALAAGHKGIVAVATVHPYDGQAALDELTRVAARGVRILKIHPHTQGFDASDPRVLTLVTKAGELGITVLMDNANILPGDNQKLFNLAVAAQNTRFIFAHIGGMDFRFWNMLALARTADGFALGNVWFDISGAVQLAADSPIEAEFVWTLRNVGIKQLLLGSDYPQMTLASAVEALNKLDLTAEEKTAIQSGNAMRLLATAGKSD
ncbi:MAG: amidohydrolase [Steroidobacteraceae bacterium]|jgi:predicted TIM-barrel fold metal-dependent hydrolase|nr:amidohydrolase [Steroidobacteraceae bacterium]